MINYNAKELKRLANVCLEAPKFSEETYKEKQVKRNPSAPPEIYAAEPVALSIPR